MSKKPFLYSILFFLAGSTVFLAGCRPVVNLEDTLPEPTEITPQSSAQAQASSKFDACDLLTEADAEQILGKAVDKPTNPMHGNETFSVDSCEYQVKGGTPLDNASLIVTVPANGDMARARAVFNSGKQADQMAYNIVPVDVPGIGDAAYWVGGESHKLAILKGNINITLSSSTQKGDSASQALLDLAKVVLGRLP